MFLCLGQTVAYCVSDECLKFTVCKGRTVSYCSALREELLLEVFELLLRVEVHRDVTHPTTCEASGLLASDSTHVLLCE